MIVIYTMVVGVLITVLTCEWHCPSVQLNSWSQHMTARETRVAEETANVDYLALLVARQRDEKDEKKGEQRQWS